MVSDEEGSGQVSVTEVQVSSLGTFSFEGGRGSDKITHRNGHLTEQERCTAAVTSGGYCSLSLFNNIVR